MHSAAILPGVPVPLGGIGAEPVPLPLAAVSVHAGFPSPADDFLCKRIDLNEILVTHPQATFLFRVAGDSMRDFGIHDGCVVVVNRALRARHSNIVLATLDGEFTVKQLHVRAGRMKLKAGNPTYPDIVPMDGQSLDVWGVVTSAIKQFKP